MGAATARTEFTSLPGALASFLPPELDAEEALPDDARHLGAACAARGATGVRKLDSVGEARDGCWGAEVPHVGRTSVFGRLAP